MYIVKSGFGLIYGLCTTLYSISRRPYLTKFKFKLLNDVGLSNKAMLGRLHLRISIASYVQSLL